jgi:uncharacterized membrane protein
MDEQHEGGSRDLQGQLARLAHDETAELKARLAKLTQADVAEELHVSARLRNYFLTGLVIIGPIAITLYTTWHFINVVDAWVKPYVPRIYNPESYFSFPIPGLGLLFAALGLTVIGALAANLLGRSLISAGELMLGRMPIVRNVYHGVKDVFTTVVATTNTYESVQKVVLVQFPSRDIWSLAFVTGDAAGEISARASGEDLISVFIVHGLLPPSGFTCFVPRKAVRPVKMSIEDAAKIILSAGMAKPEVRRTRPSSLSGENDAPTGGAS